MYSYGFVCSLYGARALRFAAQAYHAGANVLSDVNLRLRAGQVTVLLGHKASSKTALLASILGAPALQVVLVRSTQYAQMLAVDYPELLTAR